VAKENGPKHFDTGDRGGRLAPLSRAAARALLVESLWPPVVWAIAVAILFVALSCLGVWLSAPRALRIAGVAVFALGLAIALAPLVRLRWPASRDVTARLDRDSGAAHRPATSLADSLANGDDPMTQALWAEHRRRLERSLEAIQVARPARAWPSTTPMRSASAWR